MLSHLLAACLAAQAPSAQAGWHAADAVLYVEIPDAQRMLAAYPRAPWIQLTKDEAVRERFARAFEEMNIDLARGRELFLRALDVPDEGAPRSLDEVAAWLHTIRAASLSVEITESAAGEFATTFARVSEAFVELHALEASIETYTQAHDGAAPPSLDALDVAPEKRVDPWGTPYELSPAADGSAPSVKSLGADAKAGGTGIAADVDASFDLDAWLTAELEKRLGFTAVVDFLDEANARKAADALTMLISAPNATSANLRGRPAELVRFEIAQLERLPGWMLRAGGLLVVGLGSSRVEALTQRAEGGAPSLASSAAFKGFEARLAAASGAPLARGWSNGTALRAPLENFLAQMGQSGTAMQSFFGGYGEAGWRMQLDGERFVTEIVSRQDARAHGWTAALGYSAVPGDLARFVPEDAIAVYLTTLDAHGLYEQLLALLGVADETAKEEAAKQLAELERRHGFDLARDVFGNLGPGAAAYLLPISTVASLPGAAVVLDVRDAAALERGLNGLTAALGESSGGTVKTKFKKYKDAPMWTFSFAEDDTGGMNPFAVSPTIVLVKGHAILTLNSVRATKEVRRALGEEGAPHRLLSLAKPPPPEATCIGFMDWSAFFDGVYTTGKSALSLLGANAPVPFDVNKAVAALPESKAITRYFQPTVLWSKPIEGGSYTRWESSFGPETWASLIVYGTEIGFAVQELFENPPAEASDSEVADVGTDEVEATNATLEFLATRLAVFQLDQGRPPKTLDELAQPTKDYPSGFLDGQALPLDAWNHAFAYELVAEGARYRLWSLGPDGVDSRGSGDDLLAP